MQICYNDDVSFEDAERQIYSYTHSEVGSLVLKKWNFPEILMKAVLKHHTFDFDEDEDPYQVSLTCVVGLANLFCHKTGIGVREPDESLNLLQAFPAQLLALDQKMLDSALERFKLSFEQDKSFFD
jgi:HD-like signal output (HDOD) protein